MGTPLAGEVIATILRHVARLTGGKRARLRAVNAAALAFPSVALHLRALADSRIAHWPFVDEVGLVLRRAGGDRGVRSRDRGTIVGWRSSPPRRARCSS
jgi:hypothetical protein